MAGMMITGCQPHRAVPRERVCHLQIDAPLHEDMIVQSRQSRQAEGGTECDSVATVHGDTAVLSLGTGCGSFGLAGCSGDPRVVLVIIVCFLAVVIVVAIVTAIVGSYQSSRPLPSADGAAWQLRCLEGGGGDGASRAWRPLRIARDASVRVPAAWQPTLQQGTVRYELSLRDHPTWSMPVVGVLRGDALLLSLPAARR
jgi:hypothetical protein